jgi:hypothetical protein
MADPIPLPGSASSSKPVWQSATVWFNALALIYEGLVQAGIIAAIPAPWGPIVLTLGNLLLRVFKTNSAVTLL